MNEARIPTLRIVKILDKETLVLGGDVDKFKKGDTLSILAVGPKMAELGGAPLVLEKARLVITEHAGAYVIAAPPGRQVEVQSSLAALSGLSSTKTVWRRDTLCVEEGELSGNPANRKVAVGDPVIHYGQLKQFVTSLLEPEKVAKE